ncbi:MAG: T9SS C-terminal target domain-containing protein, partial [Bacteroidota bacterium]
MKTIIKTILWMLPVLATLQVSAREPEKSGQQKQQTKPVASAGNKAAACSPATAVASLSFNNARVRIENGGNMWQNRSNGTPDYEIPKGSGKRSMYAGALWMGGLDPKGQLKVAAVTFRNTGNDFWPGPLTNDLTASTDDISCSAWDQFFHAFRPDVINHIAYHRAKMDDPDNLDILYPDGYAMPSYFNDWPANSKDPRFDFKLAPFIDLNGDGVYSPEEGDAPGYDLDGAIKCREQTRDVPLFGDSTIYWIFNDKGNTHTETNSLEPIGMEIRAQAFAFAEKNAINNMTFYNYVLINQGSTQLTQTYFGQWADVDLGNPGDDFVGCDVSRGLGYAYNGDNDDDISGGQSPGYGTTPPAIGIDFFQGPFQDSDQKDNIGPYDSLLAPFGKKTPITFAEADLDKGIPYSGIGIGYGDGIIDNERFGMRKFVYHKIGSGPVNDPTNAKAYYNYLTGRWIQGEPFVYGGDAYFRSATGCPAQPVSPTAFCDFMFPGTTDPLNFGTRGVDYGCVWDETSAGNQPGDRRFMQSAGPFTLYPGQVNNITVGVVWARATSGDALSSVTALKAADDLAQGLFDNCFQLFEGPDAPDLEITELDGQLVIALKNPISSNNANEDYTKVRTELIGTRDPVYRFEGYMVFQVKNDQVTVEDIYDETKAKLVFQCDKKNFNKDLKGKDDPTRPIGRIINYEIDERMKLPVPQIMVDGSNGGIFHSFLVKEDKFSGLADKTLINHRPYYFIALAYGYNNFEDFNPVALSGQPEPFVASRKNGRAGSILPFIGIPHLNTPENGGTIVNTVYGTGLPV